MSSGKKLVAEYDTYEYEDAVHIVFEGIDPGFVVTLRFTQMKRPHGIGIVIEISDHVRHFGRNWRIGVGKISDARSNISTCMFLAC